MDEGIYDFMASDSGKESSSESILAKMGDEYQPINEEANQRLANAAAEAMKIIAEDK